MWRFIVIRYENFRQSVWPVRGGHVSIGMELHADPLGLSEAIQRVITEQGL